MTEQKPPKSKANPNWDELFASMDKTRAIWRFTRADEVMLVLTKYSDDEVEIRIHVNGTTIERLVFTDPKEADEYLIAKRSELLTQGWVKSLTMVH